MRVLLDTNVLVSTAIMPQGKPGQIFQRAASRFDLICSEYILEELADVLARPRIQKKYQSLVTSDRRAQFIALVRSLAIIVEVQVTLDVVSDADDNAVVAGAVDGRADFLVTGDPHLLALRQYEQCRIVNPDQFLAILREQERS
jgi:putative PIN family toxin of toxin-antitoxin system